MSSRLEEFKGFIKTHPLLKDEVTSKKRTWQSIYEDWVLDEEDSQWDKYKKKDENKTEDKKEESSKVGTTSSTDDLIKNIVGYAKKINPDTITKTIDSIQKVIGLLGSFGAGGAMGAATNTKKKTGDPLFDRRFDDWY